MSLQRQILIFPKALPVSLSNGKAGLNDFQCSVGAIRERPFIFITLIFQGYTD